MKRMIVLTVLALAIMSLPPTSADAAYCANYDDGTRTCGIATLESCKQSIGGTGGYCGPDETSELPPNLMQRLRRRNPYRLLPDANAPSGPVQLPPPPGE